MNTHPDFSGVWQVDFPRCKLEIQAPAESIFTIRHKEPLLSLTRTHRAEGYEDTFSLDLSTDGKQCITHKGELEIRSTCVWQDSSLRFHSLILGKGFEAKNTVLYAMSEDGREIVADETYTGPPKDYHNKWVLVRSNTSV